MLRNERCKSFRIAGDRAALEVRIPVADTAGSHRANCTVGSAMSS